MANDRVSLKKNRDPANEEFTLQFHKSATQDIFREGNQFGASLGEVNKAQIKMKRCITKDEVSTQGVKLKDFVVLDRQNYEIIADHRGTSGR